MTGGDDAYEFSGAVELFPQEGGWHYLAVPPHVSDDLVELADRGLIAVDATVGGTTWPTSLLPKGDGSHFIALNAKVRRAEGLDVGDRVGARVTPRSR